MRDNRGGSRAVSTTADLGKTWTEHPSSRSVLQEPVCMASLIKVEAKDNVYGKDILLFSNPNTTEGRHHITIKASLDGGLSFPVEYDVLLDEGYGWGYSCLTLIDAETVGILYESSVAHMTFQAVPLKDILK
jgi:sialidase-1